MMQRHMLTNMRNHLLAIAQIQHALAEGDFDAAGAIAEERLGMSSLASHGASHMAPYMPEPMRAIGTQMHRAASRFALVAQDASVDRDLPRALKALFAVTEQCVACHGAYRIH
jgi:mono/diheme cytochrome c family protein